MEDERVSGIFKHVCSATLIHERVAITAAHCVTSMTNERGFVLKRQHSNDSFLLRRTSFRALSRAKVRVVSGIHYLGLQQFSSQPSVRHKISDMIVHPKYDAYSGIAPYDIAILR